MSTHEQDLDIAKADYLYKLRFRLEHRFLELKMQQGSIRVFSLDDVRSVLS